MAAAKKTQVAKETATEKKPVEMNRVKARYINEVVPYLVKKFNYKNVNQVPKLVKITLNTGLGDVKDNAKSIQLAVEELKTISGQKPLTIAARKSVANFKVREGMTVGAKVTLRAIACTNFSISSFPSRFRESGTSAAFPQSPSTAGATMRWA